MLPLQPESPDDLPDGSDYQGNCEQGPEEPECRCLRGNEGEINGFCGSCYDMTAEFADLSVGSARSPEGWEVDRGWNQLIARTGKGVELIELARLKGVLEFKEVPEGNLEKLKTAAGAKKRKCLEGLGAKTAADEGRERVKQTGARLVK